MDETPPSNLPTRPFVADETPDLAATGKPTLAAGVPRYRAVRTHVVGGLGEIHIAEDTELGRAVALKRIKAEFRNDAGSVRRFLREAEITARLEHPAIVPVHGLVRDADGQPAYAMRFVEGETLKQAIDRYHAAPHSPGEHNLAFRQLLQNFVAVCHALAFAHSRGVIHRDLKPANILLGEFGETLVVDWGLAKRVGVVRAGKADLEGMLTIAEETPSDATGMGQAVGTPAYMAPEQAAGRWDVVGPAADIYSLGATLYQLLTGRSPYQANNKFEVLALVQRGALLPPRQAKRDVPAPLDAVCRKAMALEPEQRYATAAELAREVERWLADEPVTAYRDPWAVRVARQARRHRTAVVAGAVFLVSAVIALSISTVLVSGEQRRTAAQKRIAEENSVLARDVTYGAIPLIESQEAFFAADPALHVARRDLLVAAARTCRQYLAANPDDPELRRRTAQVYRYTANVHRMEANIDAAEELFLESLGLLKGLAQDHGEEAFYAEKLSETLRDHAFVLQKQGRLREATESLEEAIGLAKALAEVDPGSPGPRRVWAAALLGLASVQYAVRGQRSQAGRTAQDAINHFEPLARLPVGQRHPYDPLMLAAALSVRAAAEREAGKLKSAVASHRDAIKLLDEMKANRPAGVNPDDVTNYLANCRVEQCRTRAKIPNSRANAEINLSLAAKEWQSLARKFPTLPDYRESESTAYQLLGLICLEDHRLTEAANHLMKSRELFRELVDKYPNLPAYHGLLGKTCLALCRVAQAEGQDVTARVRFDEATAAARKAIALSPDDADYVQLQRETKEAERSP